MIQGDCMAKIRALGKHYQALGLLISISAVGIIAPSLHAQALAAQYIPIATTLIGNGTAGYAGDLGLATASGVELHTPSSVVYEGFHNGVMKPSALARHSISS